MTSSSARRSEFCCPVYVTVMTIVLRSNWFLLTSRSYLTARVSDLGTNGPCISVPSIYPSYAKPEEQTPTQSIRCNQAQSPRSNFPMQLALASGIISLHSPPSQASTIDQSPAHEAGRRSPSPHSALMLSAQRHLPSAIRCPFTHDPPDNRHEAPKQAVSPQVGSVQEGCGCVHSRHQPRKSVDHFIDSQPATGPRIVVPNAMQPLTRQ